MIAEHRVALSGHRVLPDGFDREKLYDELEALILEKYDYFLCGMARGFDLAALEALADLKHRYHVCIEACIPYRMQTETFSERNKKLYENLLGACDKITVLSEEYYRGCMQARNRYMVDHADLLFVYCTQETGGTAYTLRYAEKTGVEIRTFGDRKDG